MSKTTLIKATQLNRFYGPTHAVKNLDFELHSGDILGFLGPNGAGKSTSMQIISGSLAPSSGEILINGIDLIEKPTEAKLQIGYLPEQPPLYKELTVDEYLQYCGQLRRIAKADLNAAVAKTKQRCGLATVGHKLINNLSKGYQQRVGIAQAIIHNPAVIILDEPTVGLDPIQIKEIRALIIELGKDHGIILSTHILPEVQAVCNRVQIIRDGELVYNSDMATLEKTMQQSLLQVAFSAPVNAAELEAIAGIRQVTPMADGEFNLQITDETTALNTLVKTAVEKNWGLRKLMPVQRSLEQIFIELTLQEPGNQSSISTGETP